MPDPTDVQQPTSASAPPPVAAHTPEAPHARLMNMIQGLSVGLGSFGRAIATGGREGGVADVQAYQEGQQKILLAQQANERANVQQQQELAESKGRMAYNRALTNHQVMANDLLHQTADATVQKAYTDAQDSVLDFYIKKVGNPVASIMMTKGGDPHALMGAVNSAANGDLVNHSAIINHDGSPGQGGKVNVISNKQAAGVTADHDDMSAALMQDNKYLQVVSAKLGESDPAVKQAKTYFDQMNQAPTMNAEDFLRAHFNLVNTLATADAKREATLGVRKENAEVSSAESNAGKAKSEEKTQGIIAENKATDESLGQEEKRASIAKSNLELKALATGNSNFTGPDYLKTLSPGRQAQVQAIGEGRVQANSRTFSSAQGQALLADVAQSYPGFDQSKAESYFATRKDFTSGKTAQGLNSLNTVATHLSRMLDHTSAASTVPGLRSISALGGGEAAALNSDKQAVASELAKAYSGGAMTEGEMKDWERKLNVWSPDELKGNIREIGALLQGKLEAYKNQWDNGMPSGSVAPVQIVSPTARAAFQHISGGGVGGVSVGSVIQQNGKSFVVKSVDANGKVTAADPQ